MNSAISRLLRLEDPVLHEGRLGLLCNHVAFDADTGSYLHELLADRGTLKRVFVPEHGLFAELQDQEPLPDAGVYAQKGKDIEFVSLYAGTEDSLRVSPAQLQDLDALVIALQDVGSRYYTFVVTLSYVLDQLARTNSGISVYVIDYENPAGRWVEGTPLPADYTSFIGRAGMLHRHGMTVAELCRYFQSESGCKWKLEIVPLDEPAVERMRADRPLMPVPPSPNMPLVETGRVYAGQCLLEGINVSEGRGTTRPFEIFGAPWMVQGKANSIPDQLKKTEGAVLRKLRFRPTFHKYTNEICEGYQIHLTGKPFHSLAFSLQMIRWIRENWSDRFEFLPGAYEHLSERTAIELLAGDPLMLGYLKGDISFTPVTQTMMEAESAWIQKMQSFQLYDVPFRQAPCDQNLLPSE